jgi:DMSO/TMAO reductase YedYZ molybdopterin-dependent catalytic subunit
MGTRTLTVKGLVEGGPIEHDHVRCAGVPERHQVADVGTLVEGRKGRAVTLKGLLELSAPMREARYINVVSGDASFAVSVPLEELAEAVLVYEVDGRPLDPDKDGPFRMFVPGHADACVNVKQVVGLELAAERGRDTRPVDDEEHAKLHAEQDAKRRGG